MTPTPRAGAASRGEIVVHVYGRTDVGRAREHNEDAFAVADLTTGTVTLLAESHTYRVGERGLLFMVADGMGGAAAGELASAMAVDVVLDELRARWGEAPKHDPETFAAGPHALE
jgi:serine/threonine protein phosphatase PrpC